MWSNRKPVKALLFDVGGVLVKTQLEIFFQVGSLLFGCSEQALETHIASRVRDLERGEIDSYAVWEELGRTLKTRPKPEKIEKVWTETIEATLEIDPEMLGLCKQLRGVLPMGALSNTIADHANYLRSLDLYKLFNPCVLSYEVGMRKPDREIYKLACDLLSTPPENCLFIDDLEVNVKAAKAVKMQTHLFTGREKLEKRLEKAGLC
jgi:putative hydrolase of the HAD superfamily